MTTEEKGTVVKLGHNKSLLTLSPREIEIKSCEEALRPATPAEIATVLAGLTAVYGAPDGWEFASKLYMDLFSGLPLAVLSEAVETYMNRIISTPSALKVLLLDVETVSGQPRSGAMHG